MSLRIGILADTNLQSYSLRAVVRDCGNTVFQSLLREQLVAQSASAEGPDAWIVELDMGRPDSAALETWLEAIEVPVIFGDGAAPAPGSEAFEHWSRRLGSKIDGLEGSINLLRSPDTQAQNVWVLGASTGGPEAVSEFLHQLPAGLGIAFVYVQHLDAEFDALLAQVMSKNSHYPAYLPKHGDILRRDAVAVIQPDCRVEVCDNGTLVMHSEAWRGDFSPCIDQVLANVGDIYGCRSGAIIFSGMGSDGVSGSRVLKRAGGEVWVQTPDTCVCSSMPDEALASQVVSFSGDPGALALRLQQRLRAKTDQLLSL